MLVLSLLLLPCLGPSWAVLLDREGRPVEGSSLGVERLAGVDFAFGTHQEFLSLPRPLLGHLSAGQALHLLRPGRVDYDETTLTPPAINYVHDRDVDAQLLESISRATALYGVPVHPSGYRSRRIRSALAPWPVLSVHPLGQADVLKVLATEDEALLAGTDLQLHTPLYNATQIAHNARQRGPLPEPLFRFVEAALSSGHQSNMVPYVGVQGTCPVTGQGRVHDDATESFAPWWEQLLERILEAAKAMINSLIRWVVGPSKDLMCVRQALVSFPRQKITRWIGCWPCPSTCKAIARRSSSMAPIVRRPEFLSARHVGLVDEAQRSIWGEARRRSLLYHMLLVSIAGTGMDAEYYSFGEEDHTPSEELTRMCPVHQHMDGSRRRGSQYERPQDPLTGQCTCHFH